MLVIKIKERPTMVVTVAEAKTYTADEYLALEVELETRSEYRNGAILPMTGGTPIHNEITGNLIFLFKAALRRQPYSIFVMDQRLWIPECNIYTYPDVMVILRLIALQPGRKDTVINPILIVELLSDSTENYDHGDKFAAYRKIKQYARQNANQWLFTEYDGEEARVALASIPVEIALVDLYENVEF